MFAFTKRRSIEGEAPCDRLHRVPEASERLAISERTLWAWIANGRLPAVRLGRATRVRESDLRRLIAEGVTEREEVRDAR